MPRSPNLVDTSPRALVINRRHDPIVEPLPAYGHVERRRLAEDLHARKVEAVHRFLVEALSIDDTDVATAIVRIVGAVR